MHRKAHEEDRRIRTGHFEVSGSRSLVGLDAKNKVASDSKTLKS